ncbi:ABC transporter transmembrane domain-containing protein [Paenibacillus tepidiphilus]|uniref:ABC transporter transmembrane domain-containing protein n=1 Tax=Paenibacillus tepidiphilus TaxID=2608683 RepID=UPI001EF0B351|nr:ABC transporter transmembrane domain-containing protein [Paenibacillus tepidiphilus]
MIKQCMVQFRGWILLHIALGFIIQALGALEIVKLQEILDTAVAGSPLKTLTALIVVYGLLRGAAALLNYVDEYPSALLANGIPERLKVLALAKISRMDYQAYQNIGTGQMIKVIENGAAAGGGMLNSFVLQTLHELLPTILFSLIFLGFYDMRIMLVIAAGYAVVFVIAGRLLKVLYRMKSSILAEQEAVSRYSVRGFMELVVFRLNKRYNREIAAIGASAQHLVRQSARLQMIHESFFAIFEVFITVIKVGVLLYGVRSVVAGGTSPGVLVALIMFIDKVYTPIAIFNVLFVNYKLNRVAYERFAEFIHAPEDRNLHTGLAVQELRGDIELKDVSFAYGNNSILRELTVSIAGGTTVCAGRPQREREVDGGEAAGGSAQKKRRLHPAGRPRAGRTEPGQLL